MTGLELPVILGIVSATGAVAGTATAGITSAVQSNNQRKLYEYNAEVDRLNAQQQLENASYEEKRRKEQLTRTLGEQYANYSASGVTLSGSALSVIDDTTIQGELDVLTAKFQGKLGYNAYNQSSNDNLSKAALASKTGKTALTGGLIGSAFSGVAAFNSASKSSNFTNLSSTGKSTISYSNDAPGLGGLSLA